MITAIMCAFREKDRIKAAIHQFDGFPIQTIVACSKTSWQGNQEGDDTYLVAREHGAIAELGDWKEEHEQKNWLMDQVKTDWVIMSAPDMYLTKESLREILDFVASHPKERAYGCGMKTYWKNFNTILKPDWPFNTVLIRRDMRFQYSAIPEDNQIRNLIAGVLMHHLSFVRTNEEMKTKIETYSHADEIVKDWYQDKWLKDSEVELGPCTPSDFKYKTKYELPDEIKKLLYKYSGEWVKKL